MHYYTNSKGERVEVSKEHLDTAVELKLQLQGASPSLKCNWKLHKEMMEEEGYFDSDKNEAYRCMVKSYQSQIGKLAEKEKYADLVVDSKLQSIQNAVGDLYYQKRLMQEEGLKMNRVKRELTKTAIIAEMVTDAFLDEKVINIPHYSYQPKLTLGSKKKMVVTLTDWHVGATVENVYGNNYNYDIALKRLNKYKDNIISECLLYNIKDVTVACLGDMIEHVSMRNVNQAFEAEFNFAVQINKATDLIIEFITHLSEYFNVTYIGISGNHDRSLGDKNANIDGDNVMVIVNQNVNRFINTANTQRLKSLDSDNILYSANIELNGSKIKFVHGDNDSKQDSNKISKHNDMDKVRYDALVMGHYHHYTVIERNYGSQEIYSGSPMGRNNYSKKIKASSDASQAIIIVHEDGTIEPKRISLQNY